MFKNYLVISIRNIFKNKVYSAINIFGFAVGLAAFILLALYVQYELSYDKYNVNSDRIYRVVRNKPSGESGEIIKTAVTPTPLAPLLVDEFPEIKNATRIIRTNDVLITYGNSNFLEEKAHWSDSETFNIFTIPFIKGDPKNVFKDPFSVVLSKSTAEKYFGSENPIGKIINVDKKNDFKVTGIFTDMPSNSHFTMDIVFPIKAYFKLIGKEMTSWAGNFLYTYILLDKNADWHLLQRKFPAMLDTHIYQKYNLNVPDKFKEKLVLQPLTSIHLHSRRNQEIEANGDFTDVTMMGSIAILFLIIACINYINLSTAKSGQRAKEVGLRKVIGAKRSQLIYQFFNESMILTIIAFIISLVLVSLFLPFFNQLIECPLSFNPFTNSSLFLGIIILVVFVGLFAGSFPAIMISGFKPLSVLRGAFTRTSKGSMIRNLLVLTQFAITIIFLSLTFILKDQMKFVLNKDAGFNKKQIVTLKIDNESIRKNIETVKEELMHRPGILEVSASYRLPNNIDEHQSYKRSGSSSGLKFMIYYNFADYDFINLYGIKIDKGRNFSKEFPSDLKGAFLINEEAAKAAGWKNPVGQELESFLGVKGKIVGVLKDFHLRSFHFPIEPVYIMLDNGRYASFLSVKISPNNIPAEIQQIKSVIKRFSPDYPFEYKFFDDVFSAQYSNEQKMTSIFSGFSILAVIVACLGLFGLASFIASNRTKEIGIRKSLGASVPNIFFLLSKEFLKWILLANIIAWPVSYYFISGWLNNFSYRIDIGLWIFILSGGIAFVIALTTVSFQAIKAATTNPVESLKYE